MKSIKGSQTAQAVCLPGQLLVVHREEDSNIQSFSFLALKVKQFSEPRTNRGMLNRPCFLWEIRMAKGLCLVGPQ